jgi:DNA helicase HerA-like ATPase
MKFNDILTTDILKEGRKQEAFVGRPFYIDFTKLHLLTCDAWKYKVNGIPQGSFLLAFYNGESGVDEALLLRVIAPTKLPTDDDNIRSMVAYYKENIPIEGRAGGELESKLDEFTRYEFGFSAIECSILGVFYNVDATDKNGQRKKRTDFGADVENFYSANNYKVYKATDKVLQKIVNQRDDRDTIEGNENEFEIGFVRYSSSRRFQHDLEKVPVWISPKDFLGKRTALFGMTRTGKSNSVKKIIQATTEISSKAKRTLSQDIQGIKRLNKETDKDALKELIKELTLPFEKDAPKYPAGQIIFDINGEYANANMQDEGTAIFEIYKSQVERYSVLEKEEFSVMKINFYREINSGFELIKSSLQEEKGDYIKSFLAIDLIEPENYHVAIANKTHDEKVATINYDRKKALYQCCLHAAQFQLPSDMKDVKFYGDKDTINTIIPSIQPHNRITFEQAIDWFTAIYEASGDPQYDVIFDNFRDSKGYSFLDEDIKALMVFLTRKSTPRSDNATLSGFRKLRAFKELHTSVSNSSFEVDILNHLRKGKIVIIDLSQGNPKIQKLYSDKICKSIFDDSMGNFIRMFPNNFIQFYFEEAHNLFPKKEDKDLSDIYNRLAKEGAKLNLGMLYATQEVSSISSNILKNTQNWFIAHLNNEDELKEIRKYYDFSDFTDSLIRFSATNDKGFVRMKTYTNPFVVPVQIGLFPNNK